MNTQNEIALEEAEYWRALGRADADNDRPARFGRSKARGVFARGDWPHDDTDESDAGAAYLEGFDS